jgi:hypothetical protein
MVPQTRITNTATTRSSTCVVLSTRNRWHKRSSGANPKAEFEWLAGRKRQNRHRFMTQNEQTETHV